MQRSLGFVLLALAAAGCGHSIASQKDYNNNYIYGKVTVNGQPLSAGSITFVSESGRKFKGVIWRDGTYVVHNTKPGPAKIVLDGEAIGFQGPAGGKNLPNLPQARKVKFPSQYLSEASTPLKYDIKPTKQEYALDVEIDPAEWSRLNPNSASPDKREPPTAPQKGTQPEPSAPAKKVENKIPTIPEKSKTPGK